MRSDFVKTAHDDVKTKRFKKSGCSEGWNALRFFSTRQLNFASKKRITLIMLMVLQLQHHAAGKSLVLGVNGMEEAALMPQRLSPYQPCIGLHQVNSWTSNEGWNAD